LQCLDFTLGAEHLQQLDTVSRPTLAFPQTFLALDSIQETLLGVNFRERLDRGNR
jgi:hypothetical protein